MLYYTKHATPIYTDMQLPINIIGSGSHGNSVHIAPLRLIIDLGFTYQKMIDNVNLDQIDFIALTHEHGDHINLATLKRVVKRHPHLRIIMSERLAHVLANKDATLKDKIKHKVITFPFDKPFVMETRDKDAYTVIPHSTAHGDIVNVAYEITYDKSQTHLLYATDLDTFDAHPSGFPAGLPKGQQLAFNLIFLEANYDEDVLNDYIERHEQDLRYIRTTNPMHLDNTDAKKLNNVIFRAKSNLRHVSEQTAIAYIRQYLTTHGVFIPMHASRTFGTYFQEMSETEQHTND